MSLILVLAALTGCSDFISNEEPESFVSSNNFYENQSQIDQAVNGAYGTLQSLYSASNRYWYITEMRSDNTTFQYNQSDRGASEDERLDFFSADPTAPLIENIWADIYYGISQSNKILSSIDKANLTSEEINRSIGQAQFIRALLYFNLVRLFGDVPLILSDINAPENAYAEAGRSSVNDVYTQIITDVQSAIEKLPSSWPASQAGRATKGAAYTLLGQVYMTRDDFESAVEAFTGVDQLSYALMDSYADLYDPNNSNNSESIFEIQYTAGVEGEESNYIYHFVPFNSGSAIIGFNDLSSPTAGYNIPTHNMVSSYEQGDLRRSSSIAFYNNEDNTQYGVAIGDSIPYIKKYAAMPVEPGRQNVNYYIYRYAQVLLWHAEALNELGRTAEAYIHINKVRERAGLSRLPTGMSQSEFRETIYHEERVESAFEGSRWFQLLRTGIAQEIMSKHGEAIKKYQTWLSSSSYNIQPYKLLLPLPFREIRLNNLEQNSGW